MLCVILTVRVLFRKGGVKNLLAEWDLVPEADQPSFVDAPYTRHMQGSHKSGAPPIQSTIVVEYRLEQEVKSGKKKRASPGCRWELFVHRINEAESFSLRGNTGLFPVALSSVVDTLPRLVLNMRTRNGRQWCGKPEVRSPSICRWFPLKPMG